MKDTSDSSIWRVRDIFVVFALYALLLYIFSFAEVRIFGTSVTSSGPSSPGLMLVEELVDACILSTLPILIVVRFYRGSVLDIGLSTRKFVVCLSSGILVGAVLWILVSILDIGVKAIIGTNVSPRYLEYLSTASSPFGYIVVLVSVVLLGPISEEIYFRGFVYTILKRKWGKTVGILISSLFFALFHFEFPSIIHAMAFGVGLALLFDVTGSLVSPIAAHIVINLMTVFFNSGG